MLVISRKKTKLTHANILFVVNTGFENQSTGLDLELVTNF